MHMDVQKADKGHNLYDPDTFKKKDADTMEIILQGKLSVSTFVDAGNELTIDYLTKGTVINSHNFLQ